MPECQLCERTVNLITRHHLVPKQKGGTIEQTVDLCQPCHKTIHATFTNTEMVQLYDSIEKLQQAEALKGYLKWIKKRDIERLRVKRRKR